MLFLGFFLIVLGVIALGLAIGVYPTVAGKTSRVCLWIVGAIGVFNVVQGAVHVMTNV